MKAVEKMGLLKMDFLGLTTLTVIDDCLKLIQAQSGREVDMATVPLDDQTTYEQVFHKALTSGVFQFESGGMRDVLRRYKPTTVEDLTALNALYRPGPIQGGMIDDFIERKWGRRKVEYELPELEVMLKETLGVIVYQEQVMQIAQRARRLLAGRSRSAAARDGQEECRGDGEAARSLCDRSGCKRSIRKDKIDVHLRPDGAVRRIRIQQVALGGVCAAGVSHGLSEDALSGRVHGGAADLAKSRSRRTWSSTSRNAARWRFAVEPPDVRSRDADFTPHRQGHPVSGLTAIKNVGRNAIDSILAARAELAEEGSTASLRCGSSASRSICAC